MTSTVENQQFPAGWQTKDLGDLCEVISGQHITTKDYNTENRGIAYLTGPADFGTLYPVISKWTEFPKKMALRGDILITVKGSGVGKINILDAEEVAISRQLMAIRAVDVDRDFLYAFLKLQFSFFQGLANGAAIPGLSRQDILGLSVPTPPIAEQKQIVAILDEAFEGIDSAIANTEKNLANARELFESYLNNIFRHKGEGWTDSTLGTVCKFQGGSQPPKTLFSSKKKEGYIRLIQIRDYKSDNHIVYIPKEKAKRFCQPDDVMIGRYGPPLFQILRGLEGAYNVALMKAIPNEEVISKDFLFYFLKNQDILNYIIASSSRTAGQTGLNKATIEPYPIAFPNLVEQAEIVDRLEALQLKAQRLEAIYQQKLAALNELKQSILQKAFSGELTAEVDGAAVEKVGAIAAA